MLSPEVIIARAPVVLRITLITPEEVEVTDGKLLGTSKLAQVVRWRGETCVLKSFGPSWNHFWQDTEAEDSQSRMVVKGFYNEARSLFWVLARPR